MSGGAIFAYLKQAKKPEWKINKLFSNTKALPISKKELREQKQNKLRSVLSREQEIVIDFSLPKVMKDKDHRFLVKQTKLLYESNLNSDVPFSLNFAGLTKDSPLYQSFSERFINFEDIIVNFLKKPINESFPNKRLVYLTPDATEALESLEPQVVYILGGLVDYQVKKNTTLRKAKELNADPRRLPIQEHMNRRADGQFSYSKILSINQVFSILLKFQETRDWKVSLPVGIPQRRGFIP